MRSILLGYASIPYDRTQSTWNCRGLVVFSATRREPSFPRRLQHLDSCGGVVAQDY